MDEFFKIIIFRSAVSNKSQIVISKRILKNLPTKKATLAKTKNF